MGFGAFKSRREARRKEKSLSLALCLAVAVTGVLAHAREDLVPGARYISGRGAAMGDAMLPLGEDAQSGLFYNPADLARIQHRRFELANFQFNTNMDTINHVGVGFYKVASLSAY